MGIRRSDAAANSIIQPVGRDVAVKGQDSVPVMGDEDLATS